MEQGRPALPRGAWEEVRIRFADALAREETPEAFEGASLAARYQAKGCSWLERETQWESEAVTGFTAGSRDWARSGRLAQRVASAESEYLTISHMPPSLAV